MAINLGKALTRVFGSRNERLLKRYHRIVDLINEFESKVRPLSDEQLRARTLELRQGLKEKKFESADILPEAFAIIREAMDRHIGVREIFNPEQTFDPDQLDDEMLEAYDQVQQRMIQTGDSWQSVPIPTRIYDAVRKLYPESRPPFRARCFDVQLIGGLVLYEGKIAEMATGEGKTFVAPLACFMKVLEGFHCHVVTVNDYLVRRDATWVRPAFETLGLTVGYIQSDMEPGGETRRRQYECDITYGTNSEFGFDFLRDNMKERVDLQVQGPLDFAIVDEVDSILIDEARTPLIISGAAHDDAPKYRAADAVARKVIELHRPYAEAEKKVDHAKRAIKAAEGDEDKARSKEEKESARRRQEEGRQQLEVAEANLKNFTQFYEVELDRKSVHLTHEGIAAAQEEAGVGSFYVGNNMEWPHLMEQALRAHVVYERDKDYVVDKGRQGEQEVVIVDEYTGRKMVGRQWSEGLHQAVEAKERVPIKQETQTLATITLQNFFKLYKSLAGMTGTAQTEAEEFMKIYRLEVVTIPTNRPCIREDNEDRVYRSEREKWDSIIEEIKLYSDMGRPVLVGTTSVEKSEMLSDRLKRKYGVEHEVLNAKQHEREAHIVLKAGHQHKNVHGEMVGNVTIATNMAGRGTDIKLANETLFDVKGLKPDSKEKGETIYTVVQRGTNKEMELSTADERSQALQLTPHAKLVGGLHVIGTERHTARRIDNQLRGRGGRQGDPGSSRFYVSLQDELMKLFAGEWTIKVLSFLGMEEGMAIEDKRISKGILRAQRKVEERNFLARKNLLDYDEVMDYQRTIFYGMRQRVLEGRAVDEVIWSMIGDSIKDAVDKYVVQDFVAATIAEWCRVNFDVVLEPGDLRGMRRLQDLEEYIKNQARAEASDNIQTTLQEYTGEDPEDSRDWDTKGLSSWAMSRFRVNLPQNQLRKMRLDQVEETLKTSALEQIDKRDCAGVAKYLEADYALRALCEWAAEKFSVRVEPDELKDKGRSTGLKTSDEIVELISERARAAYGPRELEYPVDQALAFAFGDGSDNQNVYGVDYVRAWTAAKYGIELSLDHLGTLSRRQFRDELIGYQQQFLREGKADQLVDAIMAEHKDDQAALLKAFNQRFMARIKPADLEPPVDEETNGELTQHPSARDILVEAARAFYRRELTDLEQFVLITIFDQSWKDHLYAMDMLRNSIGLQAFAEKDPRIQYKKEGYRYFEEMMIGVRDKVTDLIFRARFVGPQPQARSAYRETAAVHDTSQEYGVAENMQQPAAAGVPAGAGEMQAAADAPQGEGAKVKTIVREAPKVGRNDPCPCGSGKKYKKCCGADAA
jgi:preprotein translocase subunit SecA